MARPGAGGRARLTPAALRGWRCREVIDAKPTHGWLVRFPPVSSPPVPVIWSPNGSKIGEGDGVMVVCWRRAGQAARVGGMRRLAGWCRVI